jgi:beta-glucosidase-like glycosyl hydrolase
LVNGKYAAAMVSGMQEPDAHGHPKMLTYLKHYTAYSRETNRGHDTYNISMFDFWDTYLPQYEIAFKEGNASGVMCSYDAENGHPSCANGYILNEVIRKRWNQPNALVTTDCGAVSNMLGPPTNTPSPMLAAAWTINNGTDLEMGSTIWTTHMKDAVSAGLVSEQTITQSLTRGLRQLFHAGRFDADVWAELGLDDINSTHSQQVQREAAEQGMVLLKNGGGSSVSGAEAMLPLKTGSKIAVVGPMGVNTDLMSDYAGGTFIFRCKPSTRSLL